MFLNSFDFLLFFIVVFFVQWLLPHRPQNFFLLAASYFFYGYWDWRFLGLIMLSTGVDYYCGRAIGASADATIRKRYLVFSILVNLGALGFFKYANFFVASAQNVLTALGMHASPGHLNIILPIGISFYTFKTMSYTIDIYRREMRPANNLIDYALFVAFFPQLIAGPIERARNFLPQLTKNKKITLEALSEGTWLVFWGLFKKAVIADNLAVIVDKAFSQTTSLSGGDVLLTSYAFAIQIYADFSGYTDMARGISKMMGYDLMLNFRLPYFATGPGEFWRRWHISLSTWFRDYIYIPLGGSRQGQKKTYFNLLITMLLCGLWHGAAWTFVVWGIYHGLLLSLQRMTRAAGLTFSPNSTAGQNVWWFVRVAVTFHLICFGWLIFRSSSLGQFASLTHALLTSLAFTDASVHSLWLIILLCGPLVFLQILQKASGDTNIVLSLSIFSRSAIYAVLAIMMLSLGNFGGQEFIYARF